MCEQAVSMVPSELHPSYWQQQQIMATHGRQSHFKPETCFWVKLGLCKRLCLCTWAERTKTQNLATQAEGHRGWNSASNRLIAVT